jgi:hypothetical protein
MAGLVALSIREKRYSARFSPVQEQVDGFVVPTPATAVTDAD